MHAQSDTEEVKLGGQGGPDILNGVVVVALYRCASDVTNEPVWAACPVPQMYTG